MLREREREYSFLLNGCLHKKINVICDRTWKNMCPLFRCACLRRQIVHLQYQIIIKICIKLRVVKEDLTRWDEWTVYLWCNFTTRNNPE
jgi:hypothetical protein